MINMKNDFYERISREHEYKIKPTTTLKEWMELNWREETKEFV